MTLESDDLTQKSLLTDRKYRCILEKTDGGDNIMEEKKVNIRVVSPEDAEELLAIYAPYVEHTAITFEYEVPSLWEFRERICHVLEKYPYLAAEVDGQIAGYAYAGVFHDREAYDWCVETSIYVDQSSRKMGIGGKLHHALEEVLKLQGILNLNACIAYPEEEDEYLTKNSVEFHRHLGYDMVGEFHNCGYKFDRWYHMVWMEKMIGEHRSGQDFPKNFPQIREEAESILSKL